MRPDQVRKGERPRAAVVNRLIEATQANALTSVSGARVVRTAAGGMSIAITPGRGGRRRAGGGVHAWQIMRVGALQVRFRAGVVDGFGRTTLAPSNRNATFDVPAGKEDGYFFWLDGTITGTSDTTATLTALEIKHGDSVPDAAAGTDGAPPTTWIRPLYYVTTTSGLAARIDGAVPMVRSALSLSLVVENVTCAAVMRALVARPLE
jgi:hypothetical protein